MASFRLPSACRSSGSRVVAFDSDPVCVERYYRALRSRDDEAILPLRVDLANPSAGVGWANRERRPLLDRGQADLVLALGLVHHLRFTHNVPFDLQAEYLSRCGSHVVVEFVPAEDEMTRKLSRHKPGLLPGYDETRFLASFRRFFELEDSSQVTGSLRRLFLLRRA